MSAFNAKWLGKCAAACGSPIEPGDLVVYVDDKLVHEECEERAIGGAKRIEVVCPNCFMVKPCPCDDGQAAA
jgi:hypothetical protein